jgi:UDP-N-acetyl-D-mannosaminuronic acid transferase (WecB/TagA/CpsF family)
MGNPIQEEWILTNRDRLDVPLVLGVGALFDFTAGLVDRAPQFIRQARLEWAYRLSREPRRLLKRYTVDTARFFLIVMLQKDSASRSRPSSTHILSHHAAEAAPAGLPKGDGRACR